MNYIQIYILRTFAKMPTFSIRIWKIIVPYTEGRSVTAIRNVSRALRQLVRPYRMVSIKENLPWAGCPECHAWNLSQPSIFMCGSCSSRVITCPGRTCFDERTKTVGLVRITHALNLVMDHPSALHLLSYPPYYLENPEIFINKIPTLATRGGPIYWRGYCTACHVAYEGR